MKLAIISTMEGFVWGGSEELWFRVALHALEKQHEVLVCVKAWPAEAEKIRLLRGKGARIVLREKEETAALLDRISRKLGAKKNDPPSFIRAINDFHPDRILVSQGGTFDVFRRQEFVELIAGEAPLFLISQFNFENGNPADEKTKQNIQLLSRRWKKFYFVSQRNLETAERQVAQQLPHTQLVSNPVNYAQAGILPWPQGERLRLACVARYQCSLKGQDILLQALAAPALRSFSWELDFFGDGPDKAHLEKLITHYGLADRVKLAGHVSDIEQVWREHHALVLPSIAEGTPLVVQECMLKGRPALVTDVGDCARLIADGKEGFLAPVAAPRYLEQKLLGLFQAGMPTLEAMGRAAFEKASALVDLHAAERILLEIEAA